MHFTTEQAGEVKAWMVKKLEDISDADPEILTEYCWAIFQSDSSDEEIRKSAVENLEDFLKEHTVGFVNEIFSRYGSKLQPTIATSSSTFSISPNGQRSSHGFPIQSYQSEPPESNKLLKKFDASRKRSYQEANNYGHDIHYGNGVVSKTTRSRGVSHHNRTVGRGAPAQQLLSSTNGSVHSFLDAPVPSVSQPAYPPWDPNNPMAALAFMQAMFPQMAGMVPPPPNGGHRGLGDQARCHDYDTKGYCILGSSCPYEHGNNPIVAPRKDEYDPTKSNFSLNGTNGTTVRSRSHPRPNRGGHGSPGRFEAKRKSRASFSDTRPPRGTSLTAIVVEQIPEECLDEGTVRVFFSQFGKVVDISLNTYKHLAIINYETNAAAKRAWESPKAVFDNRFVRVYWYRPDVAVANVRNGKASVVQDSPAGLDQDFVDHDTFKQQQGEKQRAYEERVRIRKAMDEARQDITSRREAMAKEHGVLVKKLAMAEGHDIDQARDSQEADPPDPKIKALRDQLARMQAEAKSLGIDPDAPTGESGFPSHTQRAEHGRSARGAFAARGAYRGYGSPGGRHYHGSGFVRGRDSSVRKLDNRPRNILLTGVEFDHAKEENLRSYLTLVGPFEDIELNPHRADSRIIIFSERWQAEQVMHGKTDIPGVGKVEFAWAVASPNGRQRWAAPTDEEVVLVEVGEENGRTLSDEIRQPQDDNLDVAGGDDDDWGNIS